MTSVRVFAKASDAGWSRDWYWTTGGGDHGPYPFKLWARIAAVLARLKGDA